MSALYNGGPSTEAAPQTVPLPTEQIPDNPNDPFGVGRKIIEEIEEIGRRYVEPQE